jgi:hypothetical protein
VRRRIAAIEGNPVDAAAEREPRPENIAGIQVFLDDPDPRLAGVQADFISTIAREVDAIEDRLDPGARDQHSSSSSPFPRTSWGPVVIEAFQNIRFKSTTLAQIDKAAQTPAPIAQTAIPLRKGELRWFAK